MRKFATSFIISLIMCLIGFSIAIAQADELSLKLSRDWGYGGLNGDIQGLFSMHVSGPPDLVKVEFYIDDNKMGEVDKPPFDLQFNTDAYGLGVHKLHALGYSSTELKYFSNAISANFVPKQNVMKFILPVIIVVLISILISNLLPILISRKKKNIPSGAERNYGINGGSICPKCGRPFPLPLFSMNMGLSKLTVCPSCGKWIMVKRKSIDVLRQAERDELIRSRGRDFAENSTEDEKIINDLEDSKFQD
jgi:DNA-directed RNA polymerase subunit RPC12/RpoP